MHYRYAAIGGLIQVKGMLYRGTVGVAEQAAYYTCMGNQSIISLHLNRLQKLVCSCMQLRKAFATGWGCMHKVVHPGLGLVAGQVIPGLHFPLAKMQLQQAGIRMPGGMGGLR